MLTLCIRLNANRKCAHHCSKSGETRRKMCCVRLNLIATGKIVLSGRFAGDVSDCLKISAHKQGNRN